MDGETIAPSCPRCPSIDHECVDYVINLLVCRACGHQFTKDRAVPMVVAQDHVEEIE